MKLKIRGLDLNVDKRGAGNTAFVFVHYWGGTSRTWVKVADALGDFVTVAYDVRGWGNSDKTLAGYTTSDLADELLSLVETLNLTSFVLVGHSFGAKIAQLAASRKPSGLRGLVLVAPAPPTPLHLPEEIKEFQRHVYDTRDSALQAIPNLFATPPPAEIVEQIVTDSTSGSSEATLAFPTYAILEDISAEVSKISVPTLVVAAELDKVDPIEQHKTEVVSRIPYARLVVIKGSGHLIPLDQPVQLAETLRSFAATLSGGASA